MYFYSLMLFTAIFNNLSSYVTVNTTTLTINKTKYLHAVNDTYIVKHYLQYILSWATQKENQRRWR